MTGYHLYLRLLKYVRPYWWAFGIAVAGMVVVAAGDLVMAMLVIPIVQTFQTNDPGRAQWLPVAVIGVFLFRGIGSFISDYGMAYTGHRVVFDLRSELTDKLLKLPTPYYDVTPAGVVQSKLTFDAHQLAQAASSTITTAIRSTLSIVASFGWLLWVNWRLTLMTFVVMPVVAVVIRYFSRRLRRIARDVQTRTGSMTHVLEEMIGGHRIVRIFGGEDYERGRAVKAANSLRNSMTKQSSASAASSPLTQILAALAVGVIIWVALAQNQTGKLDLGMFASYLVALLTLLDRLKSLSGINAAIQRGLAAAESIFGLLDREEEPEIDPSDLRIDTYRSSGAGGQHVNVTDSAIRLTHLPTGLVVSCQNERSQHRNKDSAMKVLKARLYDIKMKENQAKLDAISGIKKEIGFGSQIRSYVLHPYQLAKDHRTKESIGDVNRVLDGDIDQFIKSYLMKKSNGTLGQVTPDEDVD